MAVTQLYFDKGLINSTRPSMGFPSVHEQRYEGTLFMPRSLSRLKGATGRLSTQLVR